MTQIYFTSSFYRLVIIGAVIALIQSVEPFKVVPFAVLLIMITWLSVGYYNHRKRSQIELKLARREGKRVFKWLV